MSAWAVIAVAGAGSFLLRISMLVLAARRGVPTIVERAAGFAVPVAFAGLAAGALASYTVRTGSSALPALVGVAAGLAAVRRTGSAPAAILVGMPTIWVLSAVTP
ncbi:MAG: AzlD domain-containing protein [Acidimicrobiales bacterium]